MMADSPYSDPSRCISELGPLPQAMPSWMVVQIRQILGTSGNAGAHFGRTTAPQKLDEARLVDQALARLRALDPRLADILRCRVFADMEPEAIAEALGISTDSVIRDWKRAKLWFYRYLRQEVESHGPAPC